MFIFLKGFYQCKAINNQGVKAEGVGILQILSNFDENRNGLSSNSVLDQHTGAGTGIDFSNTFGLSSASLDNAIVPSSGDSTFHMTQDAGTETDRVPFFQDYPRFSPESK